MNNKYLHRRKFSRIINNHQNITIGFLIHSLTRERQLQDWWWWPNYKPTWRKYKRKQYNGWEIGLGAKGIDYICPLRRRVTYFFIENLRVLHSVTTLFTFLNESVVTMCLYLPYLKCCEVSGKALRHFQ